MMVKAGPLISRTLVTAAALALGGVAALSALDRLGTPVGPLAAAMPLPVASFGWRTMAAKSLAEADPAQAIAAAERAVRADPLDAAGPSLLGAAYLARGDAAAAMGAFRVAGQRGWRDRATQVYWAMIAPALGAEDSAALRVDALLRQDPAIAGRETLLAGLHETARGRAALARRLAQNPSWRAVYLTVVYDLGPEAVAGRALTLQDRVLAPPAVACADVGALVARLVETGQVEPGRRLREHFCGQADGLTDPEFAAARLDNQGAAGWRFPGAGGLDVRLADHAGRGAKRGLVVASLIPVSQLFAVQTLYLAPGRYRVDVQVAGEGAAGQGRIGATLACAGSAPSLPAAQERGLWSVPAGCLTQRLELRLAPGEGAVRIAAVRVSRAP